MTSSSSWRKLRGRRGTGRLLMGTMMTLVVALSLTACSSVASGAAARAPGVTAKTISIGMDLPITGAGLHLGTGVEAQADLYWKWLASKGEKIDGRTVKLTVHDDTFSSSVATQVCASETPSDFILLGWQGSNVIGACAQYANSKGAPYIARGLTAGFGKYHTYFALSPTYPHEASAVALWMHKKMGAGKGAKVGVITYSGSEFNGLVNSFQAEARKLGMDVVPAQRMSLTASSAEADAAAIKMKDSDAKYVYMDLASPTFTVLTTFQEQSYFPDFVLYSASSEASSICGLLGKNRNDVYDPNPAPTLNYAKAHDPQFFTAWAKYIGGTPTNTGLYYWWEMQLVARMLKVTGTPLTRSRFLTRVEHATISSPLAAPIHYTPKDHIAATSEWMLHLSCSAKTLETAAKLTVTGS